MTPAEMRVLAQRALDYENDAETYVVGLAHEGATYRREVRATSPVAAILLAKAAAGLSGAPVQVATLYAAGQIEPKT